MTRKTFVKNIAEETGMTQKDVNIVLTVIEEEIIKVIKLEDEIQLKFALIGGRTKEPTKGYHPGRDEYTLIPPKRGFPYVVISETLKRDAVPCDYEFSEEDKEWQRMANIERKKGKK